MGGCLSLMSKQQQQKEVVAERKRTLSRPEERKVQSTSKQPCSDPLTIEDHPRPELLQPGVLCLASWSDQRLHEENSFKEYISQRLAPEWEDDEEVSSCHACQATFNVSHRKVSTLSTSLLCFSSSLLCFCTSLLLPLRHIIHMNNRMLHTLTKQHHCRRCGKIFCKKCVSYRVKLRHLDYGEKDQKACYECWHFRNHSLPLLKQGTDMWLLYLDDSHCASSSASSDVREQLHQDTSSSSSSAPASSLLRKTKVTLKLVTFPTTPSAPSSPEQLLKMGPSNTHNKMSVFLQWRPSKQEGGATKQEPHPICRRRLELSDVDFIFAGMTGSMTAHAAKTYADEEGNGEGEESKTFTLVTIKDEHLHFMLNSEEERAQWVQALRACLQQYEQKEERLEREEEAGYDLAMVDHYVSATP
ncbi:early endosome antigen 1 [Balamuthia mandrillaris]